VSIRVVVADDQELVRSGFSMIREAKPDIEVVAEAGDGEHGVRLVKELPPDVVLINIRMPVVDGIEATRCIADDLALDQVHVVVLTNYGFDEYVLDALRAGAAGFLVKDIEREDLLHAVRVAARGEALLAPSITRKLIARYIARPPAPEPGARIKELTGREHEAVVLVAQGLSNDQIADRMAISPMTAKTHVNRAMAKLRARDRAQLVILAYESGLVAPRNR
jgi:DNA-binding NarL/FixJ family response regulator